MCKMNLYKTIVWFIFMISLSVFGHNKSEAHSIKLQIPDMNGRLVFRSCETIRVQAELTDGEKIAGKFQGEISGKNHLFSQNLDTVLLINGKADWVVDLKEFKTGPYRIKVELMDEPDNRLLAEQSLVFHIVERPTEIEAYRYTVQEARRLGLSDERICEYLKTEWMSDRDLRFLAGAVDVAC